MANEALADLWAGIELPVHRRVRPRRFAGLAPLAPYFMLLPAGIMLLGISLYPLLYSIRVSLQRFSFEQPIDVGLLNYRLLLHDSLFWSSLRVTVTFAIAAVALETALGLGLALLMSRETQLFRQLRMVYVLPMIIAPVVVGIVWRLLYSADVGAVPFLASVVGVHDFNILGSPTLALPGVVLLDVWEWTPFMFLVLLAGIQSLPTEPFEAARVDGARPVQLFLTIMLPMLRPILLVALLVRTMDAFTIFDQIFVLTRGGPGISTEVISLYAYKTAFKFSQIGYAAAIVFCMVVFLVIVSVTFIALLRRNPDQR